MATRTFLAHCLWTCLNKDQALFYHADRRLTLWPQALCLMTNVIQVPNWIWCQRFSRITDPVSQLFQWTNTNLVQRLKPSRPAKPKEVVPTIRGVPKMLLLLALQAASSQAYSQPDIHLSSLHKELRSNLRKHRTPMGMLNSQTLTPNDLTRLKLVLEDLPQGLLNKTDSFPLIFDTGCSKTATGFRTDFDPGSLKPLDPPLTMTGIAGGLQVNEIGTVSYDVQMPDAEIVTIKTSAYYMPHLKCRLFSPQSYQQYMNCSEAEFTCKLNGSKFTWANGNHITVPYDPMTFLPTIRAYKDAISTAVTLGLQGCVTEDTNQNLNAKQKLLLRFHYRLGHIGFSTVQWLGRQGWLGSNGIKMGHANLAAPKCAACLYGKQKCTPSPSKHSTQDPPGALTKDKLTPGQLIFSDQYQSSVEGRGHDSFGKFAARKKFVGGTVFVDAASNFISIHHQEGLTAAETIQSKQKFEQDSINAGVSVDAYHTDNGIYKSIDFLHALSTNSQKIAFSGVDAQFQNGIAENAIKTVVSQARTIMLHAALRWPEESNKTLWPLALSQAAHLYNRTPNRESGMSPEEIFTSTRSDHHALLHAHPWGCPVYVLDPTLRGGHKIPKWRPRSRQGQYMGASSDHSSTVGLIRNLSTNSITPQFHAVYNDFFETVHSGEEEAPENWTDLIIFNSFCSEHDPDDAPDLSDEWLSQQELAQRLEERAQRRAPPAPDPNEEQARTRQQALREEQRRIQREIQQPEQPQQDPPRRQVQFADPAENAPSANTEGNDPPESSSTTIPQRSSMRSRQAPQRFEYTTLGTPTHLCARALLGVISHQIGLCNRQELDFRYLAALLIDPSEGTMEGLRPDTCMFPTALKLARGSDPDLPTWRQAMCGPDQEHWEDAVTKEVHELSEHRTWTLWKRSDLPPKVKVLPTTWVFRLKRYPDGRPKSFKARFCVRGDMQVEGVDYTESYAPVASWTTIRMLLCLSVNQGWITKQVDFSNAFVQAKLSEEVYVTTPQGFSSEEASGEEVVMKLNRSLYGLVQAPLCWYEHLTRGLKNQGLKRSSNDPCLFLGNNVIVVIYVDDCLFFGKRSEDIDKLILGLQEKDPSTGEPNFKLKVETDGSSDSVFAFLGIELVQNSQTKEITLSQPGLTQKILDSTEMSNCNSVATPALKEPLGTNAHGEHCTHNWDYAQIVGMLMYLSTNTRPDIQFAVHQCARFTHCPRHSHERAILRICRYLQGTKTQGLRFIASEEALTLDCYVDADFAGLWNVEDKEDPVCVKSRTGFVFMMGTCPILWVSKLQTEITLSTTEAEYVALSQAMRQLLPARKLLKELMTEVDGANTSDDASISSTVFEDNNGALTMATSPKLTPRSKHIHIKYHFFKSHVGDKTGISIKHINSAEQKADIFTKGLEKVIFETIRKLLMGW